MEKFPEFKHLLQEHNILRSFNINRRITKSEILKLAESMGMPSDDIQMDDIQKIVSNISQIEYECGEVPGTLQSNTQKPQQIKANYAKLAKLLAMVNFVLDIMHHENLNKQEKMFVLNKCVVDLQKFKK